MHFEIFRSSRSYAFQLLDDNAQLLLTSRTFTDMNACTEGIRTFVQLASSPAHFATTAENGSYVNTLQADGQDLVRSVSYATATEASEMIAELAADIQETNDYEVAFTEVSTQSIQRPSFAIDLDSYDFTQVSQMGQLGFEAFQNAKNNLYYFHFNDSAGRAFLYSQAYASELTRDNGIRSVIQNGSKKERYELQGQNGSFYFVLKAINGREVARSCQFATAVERDQAIALLQTQVARFAEQYKKPEKIRTRNGNPAEDKYNFSTLSQSGKGGFESFQQPENRQHYFHFNDASGKAILYSQGYGNVAGRENGIRSVIKNAYLDSRYQRGEQEGQHYFILKAGNNQEIARSPWFGSAAEMEAAIEYLKGHSVTFAQQYGVDLRTEEIQTAETQQFTLHIDRPEPATLVVTDRNIDQYDFTQKSPVGKPGFETFYSDKNQAYYFHYNDEDGNPVLFSESYPDAAVRDNGLASVKKNAPLDTRWKMVEEDGSYYYTLRSGNNQEIARGPSYNTEAAALAKLASIKSGTSNGLAALAAGTASILSGMQPMDMAEEVPVLEEMKETPVAALPLDEPVLKERTLSAEPIKLVDIPEPVKSKSAVTEPVPMAAITETTTTGGSRAGWIIGGIAAAALIGGLWWYNNQEPPISVSSAAPVETEMNANTADPVVAEEPVAAVAPETIENFQPIALYFNNDHPNPRTKSPTTTLTYGETYNAYYKQRSTFEREYSTGTPDAGNAKQEVTSFFDDKVKKGYADLVSLSDKLLDKLKAGNKVEITVTGFASPLATGDYNKMLTSRRVNSIENHFRTYKDGQFKEYMDKGLLVITEQTSGEDQAKQNISDDRTDTRSSWYSPSASTERRVEITNVTISKPQ